MYKKAFKFLTYHFIYRSGKRLASEMNRDFEPGNFVGLSTINNFLGMKSEFYFCKITNSPFLLSVMISNFSSPLRSSTTRLSPEPESSSIKCGIHCGIMPGTCSYQYSTEGSLPPGSWP